MVRLLVLYNPPEDAVAFDKYYNENHIPLAKQLPGLVRYTISRNLAANAQYYLIAELDWADMASAQAALRSPVGAACAADVAKFATTGAPSLLFEVAEV
ncbi:MAG: EthD family reductase [Trebonia sp.]|uniref:EthD family reductase n=1 Tax=Trebonia sp. TaxID=2767075 RepID=UPI003C70CF47